LVREIDSMIISSIDAEKDAALTVAKLMLTAARTAPKTGGLDSIVTAILDGEEKEKLSKTMEGIGNERDSKNVKDADAVVLIGVTNADTFKLIDLGIAIGSAAKIASEMNVDNRIMFSVGMAAQELKLLDAEVVLGIPLSIKGKNIFFDRTTT
jgi:uncharacterized ferredoxin-like protein